MTKLTFVALDSMQKFITAFLIFLCYAGFTQSNQSPIQVNPFFKKGETRKYKITYTTKSLTGEHPILNSIKEDVIIRIIDAQDSLIDVEWTYLNVTFTDSIPQYNPIMDLMNTLPQGLTVKYTIKNNKGVIKSVMNYNEISSKIKQRIDAVVERMSTDKSIDRSLIESTKFQFEMILSTEQQINEIVISDVFKFHELYDHSFTLKSKSLIQSKDIPSDKYEIQLVSIKNNLCLLEGALTEHPLSKRKGYKTYQFATPSYWLIKHTAKLETNEPIPVSQYYEIVLTNN